MTVNDLLYNCFKIPVSNLVALFVAILLLTFIVSFAIRWNMFSKANKHGWASIVPFYRHYVYYDICFGNGWFFLLPFVFFVICFVPYVGFVGMFMLLVWDYIRKYQMVRAFGRDGMLTILAVMFPTVAEFIIAFDDQEYVGPQEIKFLSKHKIGVAIVSILAIALGIVTYTKTATTVDNVTTAISESIQFADTTLKNSFLGKVLNSEDLGENSAFADEGIDYDISYEWFDNGDGTYEVDGVITNLRDTETMFIFSTSSESDYNTVYSGLISPGASVQQCFFKSVPEGSEDPTILLAAYAY